MIQQNCSNCNYKMTSTVQEIKQDILNAIQKYQDIIEQNQATIECQKSKIKDQDSIIKELRVQLNQMSKASIGKKWTIW